jgi:dihydrofolate reductase
MSISLIVAAATNHAIGKDGQLLWHLPIDLKFFKNTTWGMPVIMGRKTFEEVNKPLPGRTNIIITSNPNWQVPGTQTAASLPQALELAAATHCQEIFIIGGGEIYRQSMHLADTIYLTRVHAELEGDTFFPTFSEADWQLVSNDDYPADDRHRYAFSIQVWKRKPGQS